MCMTKSKDEVTLASIKMTLDWETWHKWFGHVGYSGLQRMCAENMVDGFTINEKSEKPDCIACIEAKHSEKPFRKQIKCTTKPGQLTHIDVWGKYDVVSINGHQYFLLLIDDATRYTTINFMKTKDEAATKVKHYLAYLKTHEKPPQAIRTDRGCYELFLLSRLTRRTPSTW